MQKTRLGKCALLAAGLACLAMPAGALITVGSVFLGYSEGKTVVVRDGLAYVGTKGTNSGLVIADVSDPNAPIEIGAIAYPWSAVSGVALDDGLAYLAEGTSLRIVDISDPTTPVEVGSLEVSNAARGIAVVDDLAYLIVGEPFSLFPFNSPNVGPSGLRVIDVANPSAPVAVGAIDFTGAPSGIEVVGDLAYIADGVGLLRTIDLSVPTAPVEIQLAESSGAPTRLTIVDGLAYVTNYTRSFQRGGLSVFDLSDPTAPDEIGYVELRSPGAFDVAVEGNFAYVAGGIPGIWAIDVSDPKAPLALGRLATPFGAVAALAVTDGVATVIDTTAFGGISNLQIVDLSMPTKPTEASITTLRGYGKTVEVVENLAYAPDGTGFLIFDVSNPESPVELGAVETPGYALDVSVVDNIAYVADNASGLRLIDVSDPTAPIEISGIDNLGSADQVEAVDEFAYVLDSFERLHVVDVSDAEAPFEVGSIETPGAYEFAIAGELVYVVGGEHSLRMIDVSNPAQPVEIGVFDGLGSGVEGIAVVDGLAYLTKSFRGLLILDVSNPQQPVEIGLFDPWYYVRKVTVVDGIAYLSAEGGLGGSGPGIYIRAVDVSDPTAPVEMGGFDFYAPAIATLSPTVVGSLVYVMGFPELTGPFLSGNGLVIIDFGPEYASKISVAIDIKPGSDAGTINPASRGVIPVAILGSDSFDIANIDTATLTFRPGGATPAHRGGGHPEDVDGDGAMDLVSHFRTQDTGITPETDRVCVSGKTLDGVAFEGCGAI